LARLKTGSNNGQIEAANVGNSHRQGSSRRDAGVSEQSLVATGSWFEPPLAGLRLLWVSWRGVIGCRTTTHCEQRERIRILAVTVMLISCTAKVLISRAQYLRCSNLKVERETHTGVGQ